MAGFFKKHIVCGLALEVKDIRSLQLLRNIYPEYVPWTGASIHPTALVYILNDIIMHNRKHIVECGSGISTLYIASILKNLGIKAVFDSVEHNEDWINVLRNYLASKELLEFVNFVHAPLTPSEMCWKNTDKWYNTSILNREVEETPIDMLLIDGPPANANGERYARYPAIPFFHKKLAQEYTIIVDDACRDAEEEIVGVWSKEYDLDFTCEVMKGDIWICGKGLKYNVL